MVTRGFDFVLFEEDTGAGDENHQDGTATEWWITFFDPAVVFAAPDLDDGFLADDRSSNPNYDRVPYAFPFRTVDGTLDFVLISVHLHQGITDADVQTRRDEIAAVQDWISTRTGTERDYVILGDMNFEDCDDVAASVAGEFETINDACAQTNTSQSTPRPFDHVVIRSAHTTEVDTDHGFRVTNLFDTMRLLWDQTEPYPGDPYDSKLFPQIFSDHHPVSFRLVPENEDDD